MHPSNFIGGSLETRRYSRSLRVSTQRSVYPIEELHRLGPDLMMAASDKDKKKPKVDSCIIKNTLGDEFKVQWKEHRLRNQRLVSSNPQSAPLLGDRPIPTSLCLSFLPPETS